MCRFFLSVMSSHSKRRRTTDIKKLQEDPPQKLSSRNSRQSTSAASPSSNRNEDRKIPLRSAQNGATARVIRITSEVSEEESDGSSIIDIVGDPSSSSSSDEAGAAESAAISPPTTPSKSKEKSPPSITPTRGTASIFCVVQHPIASVTPLPAAPASTCNICRKKLYVVRTLIRFFKKAAFANQYFLLAEASCHVSHFWLYLYYMCHKQSSIKELV